MKPFVLWTLSLLVVTAGYGQTQVRQDATPPKSTPDPKQILQNAARASRNVKVIEYQEEQVIGSQEKSAPTLTATVRQARANVPSVGFLPGKFVVEGTLKDPEPTPFAHSYDGSAVRVLNASEKAVQVIKAPTPSIVARTLGFPGMVGLPQFTQVQPFQELLDKGENFVYEGTRTIRGTLCDMIAVTQTIDHPAFGKRSTITHWFIGRQDSLPRGNVIGTVQKSLRILMVNPSSTPAEYVISTPPGYGEKLITGLEAKITGLLPIGTDAPDWTLSDPLGHAHTLKEYRGKIVIMDFWGTWCVPCQKSMPALQSLYAKFKEKGVVVIGIAVADQEGHPAEYMKRKGFTYPLMLGGDNVATLYKAVMLPTLYVIGADGKIFHAEYGFRDTVREDLTALLDRYLKAHGK